MSEVINIKNWNEAHRKEFLANAYLELGDTYLLDVDSIFETDFNSNEVLDEFIEICMNPRYLHFPVKHILNVNLFPYQLSILQTLWTKTMPMLIAARGASKTTMLAIYSIVRALLDPGVRIVIAGAGLRQSGLVFAQMEQIWRNAPVLRDICGGSEQGPRRTNLGYEWNIGISKIIGIPLGTGDKIRGIRANVIICDEFGSINPDIFETVLRGFASVQSQNTFDKVVYAYQEQALKELGLELDVDDTERIGLIGNQIIISGTATYRFNHFYDYYQKYCGLIYNKGRIPNTNQTVDHNNYAVIRIPYEQLPLGLMDRDIIDQGAATMDSSIFKMEYGCIFAKDSEGFFPASVVYGATCPLKSGDISIDFSVELNGKKTSMYVMGIDPASERDDLTISIGRLDDGYKSHIYTWSANRKKFEKDKEKSPKDYKGIDDYNTFIIRKIHDLVNRFNIQRIHIDSGGGGRSIIEGLKDTSKLKGGEACLYDMDDLEVAGMKGLHIIKVCEFSKRDWYETAHYNLLKDLTARSYLFPYYDPIAIENTRFEGEHVSLINDTIDSISGEIEQVKYQTTLIQEQKTPKGSKTWDLPKVKGVITEDIKVQLKKDHFTSLLLCCDAARDFLKEDDAVLTPVGGTTLSRAVGRHSDKPSQRYTFKGDKNRHLQYEDYNTGGLPVQRVIRRNASGV